MPSPYTTHITIAPPSETPRVLRVLRVAKVPAKHDMPCKSKKDLSEDEISLVGSINTANGKDRTAKCLAKGPKGWVSLVGKEN